MLFKRRRNNDQYTGSSIDYHSFALDILKRLCQYGIVVGDAFVIEEYDICVYVDVVGLKDDVAQAIFQLHHAWLDNPIIESVAASGESEEEAIECACENFNENILSIFLSACEQTASSEIVEGFTQERHVFNVYRSRVNGLGKREGSMEGDFWDVLRDEIIPRLGNKKAYWVKVFTSKSKHRVLCEVRMNGVEEIDLSESLLSYAQAWECLGTYHTEKQCFLLIQDDKSYEESEFSKEEIVAYTHKAMKLYVRCRDYTIYKKIRPQLIKLCRDDSLAYELFSFIPEIYCKYAYSSVEYGDKLFMMKKDKEIRELYKSQVQSYSIIEETVLQRLKMENVNRILIERVIEFSANARAIKKAMLEGEEVNNLYVPGVSYFVKDDYILR